MPFIRRRQRNPVKSDKHELTWTNLSQDASSQQTVTLVSAVQPASKNTSSEVFIGSHVKWLYLEFHFSAETVTSAKVIHWVVEKLQGTETGTGVPSLYYQVGRNTLLKRGMEMLPKDVSTVFKRIVVVRIPFRKQRIDDTGVIRFRYICSSAETINACGIAIYKELY